MYYKGTKCHGIANELITIYSFFCCIFIVFTVRFLVYINNKLKINNRFTFSGMVRLTEPCPPLINRERRIKREVVYLYRSVLEKSYDL